jgi:hypothetical protein
MAASFEEGTYLEIQMDFVAMPIIAAEVATMEAVKIWGLGASNSAALRVCGT